MVPPAQSGTKDNAGFLLSFLEIKSTIGAWPASQRMVDDRLSEVKIVLIPDIYVIPPQAMLNICNLQKKLGFKADKHSKKDSTTINSRFLFCSLSFREDAKNVSTDILTSHQESSTQGDKEEVALQAIFRLLRSPDGDILCSEIAGTE